VNDGIYLIGTLAIRTRTRDGVTRFTDAALSLFRNNVLYRRHDRLPGKCTP
jgi:hypothetical protein